MSIDDQNKIINTIIYFATHIKDLNKKKILKLLYLAQREAVVQMQSRLLNLKFQVWMYGPVANKIYFELADDKLDMLEGYVNWQFNSEFNCKIMSARAEFCDDEFSNNEVELLGEIVSRYGCLSAEELINLTHSPEYEWYKIAQEKELLEKFESKDITNTDYCIDFSTILNGNERSKFIANNEAADFFNTLKN